LLASFFKVGKSLIFDRDCEILICSEMVRRISKFEPFASGKDSMFALGILFIEEEGFVLVLPISFLESIFTKSWFNCLAIVLRMPFV